MLTRSRQRKNNRLAFTLMEVLLVMAILVILGSVVVANFGKIFGDAKIDVVKTQLNALSLPLTKYQFDVGQFPSSESGLPALRIVPSDVIPADKWRGPYLPKKLSMDPWGSEYEYERKIDPASNTSGYRIWSLGPDMSSGTTDDISVTSYDSE